MNTCDRLLRARFNPCADRVEAIGRSIDGRLDSAAEAELAAHLESCRRCRGYHLFLEAADRGFREEEGRLAVLPSLTAELPTALQEEMVEALKRNLSRWLTDAGRALMYEKGLIAPFYFDDYEGTPFDFAVSRCKAVVSSLPLFRSLTDEEESAVNEVVLVLRHLRKNESLLKAPDVFFVEAINLYDDNYTVRYYYSEWFLSRRKYEEAKQLLIDGLNRFSLKSRKARFLNNIGRIAFLCDNTDEAKSWFEKSIDFDEYHEIPANYLNVALCLLVNHDPTGALDNFKYALDCCEKLSSPATRNFYLRSSKMFISRHVKRHLNIAKNSTGLIALAENFRSVSS